MTTHEQPVLYSVDLNGCAAMAALAPESVTAAFVDALQSAGATVVQTMSHNFPGAGLTCVLILSESHAVLHTWPETGDGEHRHLLVLDQAQEPGGDRSTRPILRRHHHVRAGDSSC